MQLVRCQINGRNQKCVALDWLHLFYNRGPTALLSLLFIVIHIKSVIELRFFHTNRIITKTESRSQLSTSWTRFLYKRPKETKNGLVYTYCFRRWMTCNQSVPECWCLPCHSATVADPQQSECPMIPAVSRRTPPASYSEKQRRHTLTPRYDKLCKDLTCKQHLTN